MFPILLALHSLIRWFVLISIVYSIILAWRGWRKNTRFTKYDNWIRLITVSIAHTQLTIGLWLYFISPIVAYFLANFSQALHITQTRFFGMEHSSMMTLGVGLVTLGSSIARRKKSDKDKFKAIAIWYTIALIVIFFSIPWAFSPFTARPYLRPF